MIIECIKSALKKNFCKIYQHLRVYKYKIISTSKTLSNKPIVRQGLVVHGKGRVICGKQVIIGCKTSPFFFSGYSYIEAREKTALIEIGDNVWINNNLSVIANTGRIFIGSFVTIGWNVQIIDSDFHLKDPLLRRCMDYTSEDIWIEENVLIYSNVTILKGVKVGKNSIIASGSIVTKNVPSNVIVAGSPAKVVGTL